MVSLHVPPAPTDVRIAIAIADCRATSHNPLQRVFRKCGKVPTRCTIRVYEDRSANVVCYYVKGPNYAGVYLADRTQKGKWTISYGEVK